MATKQQILQALNAQTGAITATELGEELSEKVPSFAQQLNRLEKQGLLVKDEEKKYTLTDEGRSAALEAEEMLPPDSDGGSEEEMRVTEYQKFIEFGKAAGISPLPLIKLTADHVWRGGDYEDMEWVARAMVEMGIRRDLAQRWVNPWRSYLRKPESPEAARLLAMPVGGKGEDPERSREKASRGWMLDDNDVPYYAGESLGGMDYKDAVDLAKLRAARGRASANQNGGSGDIDNVIKIMQLLRENQGEPARAKSFIVRPNAEGGYEVEEGEEGKPVVINAPAPTNPTRTVYVKPNGEVQEVAPGQPIVIQQSPPTGPGAPAMQYLIDRSTGQVQQVASGQPLVIMRDPAPAPASAPAPTVINAVDAHGNPLVINLETYFQLEEHKAKMKREEDSHQLKVEIGKGFKELLSKAASAAARMEE